MIKRLFSSLVSWDYGSWFGSRCSGWGVYPEDRVCGGCSDCLDSYPFGSNGRDVSNS
jgi:hypothetical protein